MQDSSAEGEQARITPGRAKLLVSGVFQVASEGGESMQVCRGMPILSVEGSEVGSVAAVVVNDGERQFTHVLLGRLPDLPEYRLVARELISARAGEGIQLTISSDQIDELPVWHSPEGQI